VRHDPIAALEVDDAEAEAAAPVADLLGGEARHPQTADPGRHPAHQRGLADAGDARHEQDPAHARRRARARSGRFGRVSSSGS
jgi:hypothetical protein